MCLVRLQRLASVLFMNFCMLPFLTICTALRFQFQYWKPLMFLPSVLISWGFLLFMIFSAVSSSWNMEALECWMYCSVQTYVIPSTTTGNSVFKLLRAHSSPKKHMISSFSIWEDFANFFLLGHSALICPGSLQLKHNFCFSGHSSVKCVIIPHFKHFVELFLFGSAFVPCPGYQVLKDTIWPLWGPFIWGGMFFLIEVILTILLPVSQEVIRPLTICFSSSTWITSPNWLKMSFSLSLFKSTGTSKTMTFIIATCESSWRLILLPKIVRPSTSIWFLTQSFFKIMWKLTAYWIHFQLLCL